MMRMLYIFFKKNKTNERIIIYAYSYTEAKEALFALNSYANMIYDINEYRAQSVNTAKVEEELNITEEYSGYPYILSEADYEKIEPYIIDKQYSYMHNAHVLTKKMTDPFGINCIHDENCNSLYTLDEFKRSMQQMVENKEKQRNMIDNMINHIGDIWYAKIESPLRLGPENYVYGRSRKEVLDTLNKYDEKYKDLQKGVYLLITSYPNYTNDDIKRYDKFVTYIKEHNIKKLPFITNY